MIPGPRPDAPVFVTVGDPAGIGPEVAVAALADASLPAVPYRLVCPPDTLEQLLDALAETGGAWALRVSALRATRGTVWELEPLDDRPSALFSGHFVDADTGFIDASLQRALSRAVATGGAVVTGPTDKRFFTNIGLSRAGHTEYLARHFGTEEPLMLFDAGSLRIAVLTRHLPLAEVPSRVSRALLRRGATLAAEWVARQEGAEHGPVAVAGLDPHCGEWGAFSDTDLHVQEWVKALHEEGLPVAGPYSADTLFAPGMRQRFGAILCWYHDQGMVPVKLLAFERAVNVTLGLPVLRTSPAHGVAYDLAGKGVADAGSFASALRLARAFLSA